MHDMVKEGGEIAWSKKSGSQKIFAGQVSAAEKIKGGGVSAKYFTTVEVGRRSLSLVIKKTIISSQNCLEHYRRLKTAGIPVVDTMRLVDDRHIAMTDLRAQGAILFGKHMHTTLKDALSKNPKIRARGKKAIEAIPPNVIGRYLQATENAADIEEKLGAYALRATQEGISLPSDEVFELVIFSDGAKWTLLDIDLVTCADKTVMETNRRLWEKTLKNNQAFVRRSLATVKGTRKIISRLQLVTQ